MDGGGLTAQQQELINQGFTVIITLVDPATYVDVLPAAMDRDPYYMRDGTPMDASYALGGFATMATPASFWDPAVVKLRQDIFEALEFVLLKGLHLRDVKYAAVLDCIMVRQEGQKGPSDLAHRDVSPRKWLEGPGGVGRVAEYSSFTNLNRSEAQFFSCVAGSHVGFHPLQQPEGFSVIPPDQVPCRELWKKVAVPPGCTLVFDRGLIHEVLPSVAGPEGVNRMYLGVYATTGALPLWDPTAVIEQQGVPPKPSGQPCRILSKNHASAFLDTPSRPLPHLPPMTAIQWCAARLQPFCLQPQTRKRDGQQYWLASRPLPPMLGKWPAYPPLTAEQRAIFFPHAI